MVGTVRTKTLLMLVPSLIRRVAIAHILFWLIGTCCYRRDVFEIDGLTVYDADHDFSHVISIRKKCPRCYGNVAIVGDDGTGMGSESIATLSACGRVLLLSFSLVR